ncbi:MAG: hypothetical protein ACE5KZ_00155 [Candidatus Scalinduaceae bacterium]
MDDTDLLTIIEGWAEKLNQKLEGTVDEDALEEINEALSKIVTINKLLRRTKYDFHTFSSEESEEIRCLIEQSKKDNTKIEKLARTLRVSIDVASKIAELAANYGRHFT